MKNGTIEVALDLTINLTINLTLDLTLDLTIDASSDARAYAPVNAVNLFAASQRLAQAVVWDDNGDVRAICQSDVEGERA